MKCINCGREGPHYVPPCLGDPGFFACEAFNKYEDEKKPHVAELEKEIKARGEIYGAMCDRLHACCQKYHLGLGGEHVDRLVVEEVDRLRALETRVFQFVAMGEPITVEAFSDLAPHD